MMFARFSTAFAAVFVLVGLVTGSNAFTILPGGKCSCPRDLNGDDALALINLDEAYQCAYADGACTWNVQTGEELNVARTTCPQAKPCPDGDTSKCTCAPDIAGNVGTLINFFEVFQCAYPNGACMWDQFGSLLNTDQGNCPRQSAPCEDVPVFPN